MVIGGFFRSLPQCLPFEATLARGCPPSKSVVTDSKVGLMLPLLPLRLLAWVKCHIEDAYFAEPRRMAGSSSILDAPDGWVEPAVVTGTRDFGTAVWGRLGGVAGEAAVVDSKGK